MSFVDKINENIIISPISISVVLGTILNGVSGDLKEEILNVFNL